MEHRVEHGIWREHGARSKALREEESRWRMKEAWEEESKLRLSSVFSLQSTI